MDDLNALRAEARKLHRAVGQKVSRVRRTQGVELAGTPYDVRRNPANIKTYNRSQLNRYIETMRAFQSRSNNFLPGAQGTPIPKPVWREFKRVERAHNARIDQERARIEDVMTPSGMTTGEQREMHQRSKAKVHIGSQPTKSPFHTSNRSHENMLGEAGVRKLMKNLSAKQTERYIKRTMSGLRRNVKKAFSYDKDDKEAKDIRRRLNKLTDYQFNQLSRQHAFMENAKWQSALGKAGGTGPKGEAVNEATQKQHDDAVHVYLSWAESLPKEPPKREKQSGSKKARKA